MVRCCSFFFFFHHICIYRYLDSHFLLTLHKGIKYKISPLPTASLYVTTVTNVYYVITFPNYVLKTLQIQIRFVIPFGKTTMISAPIHCSSGLSSLRNGIEIEGRNPLDRPRKPRRRHQINCISFISSASHKIFTPKSAFNAFR